MFPQPVVLVPEGQEPIQLLNLFKGKFIVHKSSNVSAHTHTHTHTCMHAHIHTHSCTHAHTHTHTHTQEGGARLYKVCGNSVLTMKAYEVSMATSSLHSSHTFILTGRKGAWFVWAGQFSKQSERRGALIIAKTLTTKSVTTIASLHYHT